MERKPREVEDVERRKETISVDEIKVLRYLPFKDLYIKEQNLSGS